MYTIQALWTAAHHGIGAKFVICDNRSYMLLELNILQYWKDLGVDEHDFPEPFLLGEPFLDFVGLARAMGVPGVRVERPEEVGEAVRLMLERDGPFLVDMVVSSRVPGSKMKEELDSTIRRES